MTELKEAGEIRPHTGTLGTGDHSNMTRLIKWDARKKRYVYNPGGES
jgi:hypothetical protein